MKKIIGAVLALILLLSSGTAALAAGTVTLGTVTAEGTEVGICGTVSGVKAAVAVQISDENGIIAMESFPVANGSFAGTVTDLTGGSGSYTVRAADFDGGSWAKQSFRFCLSGSLQLTGTARSGSTLTAVLTEDNLADGERLSYVWKRNGETLSGATGSSYTLGSADVGCVISVTVCAGLRSGSLSAVSGVITAPAVNPAPSAAEKKSITVSGSTAAVKTAEALKTENGTVSLDLRNEKSIEAVQLESVVLEALSGLEDTAAVISLKGAEIRMDPKAVQLIAGRKSAVTISVQQGSAAAKQLNAVQTETAGRLQNPLVLAAAIRCGGTEISDLQGGSVTLTVTYDWDGSGVLRAACLQEDGKTEPVQVRYAGGRAAVTVKHFSEYVIYTEGLPPFIDVTEPTEYYYDAVKWAVEQKVTTGMTADRFGPAAPCTRAQIVTFLWRAAGSPEPEMSENPFKDIGADESFCEKAVRWAYETGITTGTSEDTFTPNGGCTRAEAVTFLWRSKGSPKAKGTSFNDVPADSYFSEATVWAAAQGITLGTGDGRFSPAQGCTRGQIVTFLWRLAQ